MRLLFVGPLWTGSTALQRAIAFEQVPGLEVTRVDSMGRVGGASFVDRVRHRLRLPADRSNLNQRLLAEAAKTRPDIVFIDSARVLVRDTIRQLRARGAVVAFYSPDDVSQPHNSSRQLESCDRDWDVFFTTKSFNVRELAARGVRRPVLVGKGFDPSVHRPMTREEVGPDFERYDAVFAGTFETARFRSINALAEAGLRVIVFGSDTRWRALDGRIQRADAKYDLGYTATLHTGRVALCFLRKLNRDRVTQRSVEIPAARRAMVAEKSDEHDAMFADGSEYVSFRDDSELVERVTALCRDDARREAIAKAGYLRCLESGYSSVDRARQMFATLSALTGR